MLENQRTIDMENLSTGLSKHIANRIVDRAMAYGVSRRRDGTG
jgi:hypothetical protein